MLTYTDFLLAMPLFSLTVTVLLIIATEAARVGRARFSQFLAITGLLVTSLLAGLNLRESGVAFQGMIATDAASSYLTILLSLAGIVTALVARPYFEHRDAHRGEFYILLLFAIIGMVLMASANDLITLFLGIELMSFCLYVLAGFERTKDKQNESALKYFLLGAFASAFLLYGIALIYGSVGSTNLDAIARAYAGISNQPLFLLGTAMLIVGLGFKVAAVPFHMWAPDVYEGAPTVVTGFMATAGKSAAFAALAIVMIRTFDIGGSTTADVLALLAAASMVLGNVVAIAQTNLKRMLAYSSVAHAGYLLAGVAAGTAEGFAGVFLYLTAYTVTTLGAFAVIGWHERTNDEGTSLDDYVGLSQHQPVIAAVMALYMFSLTGIPPFAGFIGKYYVFMAAVRADLTWLAIVGVLTSAVSAFYYLRVIVMMYFRERDGEHIPLPRIPVMIALGITAALVIVVGVLPSTVLQLFMPAM
ncbi:MAG: NADH-quinone oxidoreductase subunit N [Bacteroidetes bacterium]|jgi:NADH-quinone oxidoreductase subunit N|nr:NADH-quinone oxidoreductase subunit N [Bacteroidota bacterium]